MPFARSVAAASGDFRKSMNVLPAVASFVFVLGAAV
jgi:hypothetical protein